MKNLAASAAALLLGVGAATAGESFDLNEVAALIVYSSIQAGDDNTGDTVETFVTVTNASSEATTVHMSFVNGDSSDEVRYCYECDWDVYLTGFDTETLVFTPSANGLWTNINNLDRDYRQQEPGEPVFNSRTCQWSEGMLIAWPEEGVANPDEYNKLFGDEVVVNYTDGYAYSIPAHSIQSDDDSNSSRSFQFGSEYTRFPRVVATNFLAPTETGTPGAELVLFTLDFARQHPPESDCSLVGYDANENSFTNSVIFGCWERIPLCADPDDPTSVGFDPEFCYGNLGLDAGGVDHTHGWLALSCEVDHDADDNQDEWKDGNVHGAIIQRAAGGTDLRRTAGAPTLANSAAWARLLFQSVSKGDSGALTLEDQDTNPLGDEEDN
jgi:hypothetical protein